MQDDPAERRFTWFTPTQDSLCVRHHAHTAMAGTITQQWRYHTAAYTIVIYFEDGGCIDVGLEQPDSHGRHSLLHLCSGEAADFFRAMCEAGEEIRW